MLANFDLEFDSPENENGGVDAPIIKVLGVGGGGSNAVNHMARMGVKGIEFIICNTDIQALRDSPVKSRIQIGKSSTEGLGAGCLPSTGRAAAEENMDDIRAILERNTKVLFITAGMGGGTGTGAAPRIAQMAKELNILTIGIVSIPFEFEGRRKMLQAMKGVDELEDYVDALAIIVNDRLLDEDNPIKLSEAFAKADNVLTMAAKSIADIIMLPGFINVDLQDVCSVMRGSGVTLIGSGDGEGENRAIDAVTAALHSPLLRDQDIRGASDILVHIQYGSQEVRIEEQNIITDHIIKQVGQLVDVIWGTGNDESLGEKLRVAVVATGFNRSSRNEVHLAASPKTCNTPRVTKIQSESDYVKEKKNSVQEPAKDVERSADFVVVPKAEELHMHIEDAREIENSRPKVQKTFATQPARKPKEESNVKNETDVDSWFGSKFFGTNSSKRDFKM